MGVSGCQWLNVSRRAVVCGWWGGWGFWLCWGEVQSRDSDFLCVENPTFPQPPTYNKGQRSCSAHKEREKKNTITAEQIGLSREKRLLGNNRQNGEIIAFRFFCHSVVLKPRCSLVRGLARYLPAILCKAANAAHNESGGIGSLLTQLEPCGGHLACVFV